VLRQDFQENSLGQWGSYPPVQDVGYDPSITPTSEYGAPGGRALMRVVRPDGPGTLRLGFIRRLNLEAAPATRISLDCRIKPSRPGAAVEAAFAGADGRKYAATARAEGDGWLRAELPFPDLPAGLAVEAVYIVAVVPDADPDLDYRFIIDNVEMDLREPARFELRRPRATAIRPWRALVSSEAYTVGDTIAIEAAAPGDWQLKDQDGRVVASGALRDRGGTWVAGKQYTVSAADPTGVWRLELKGGGLTTEVRLLVRRPPSAVHPRLLFDASDRATLQARAAASEYLQRAAKGSRLGLSPSLGGRMISLLDPVHLLPTLHSYISLAGRCGDRIADGALAGFIAGDAEARADARSTLLAVAGWERWQPPWFEAHGQHTYYPAGILATDAALGYDVLYSELGETERAAVRRAFIERSIAPVFREYVLDDRILSGQSNWLGHTLGGAIMAAAAIDEAAAGPELNTYLGGLLLKLEDHLAGAYLSDGSYGEGISYQEFDLQTLTPALEVLRRVYGIDYWKRSHVGKSLYYPMYAGQNDFGDSHAPAGRSIAAVVRNSADPVLRWYYDRFPHRSRLDLLFFPDNLKPSGPPAENSRVFAEKGSAVFRTGWGDDDTVLVYHAGPNYNHHHADQGAFQLRAFGETLAAEAGPAHYYNDPYYRTYFTQAAGHSTVLVDGDPASQAFPDTPQFRAFNLYPRLLASLTSAFHDQIASELAPVYRGRLDRFTRRLIFVKPGYVVIADDLAAHGAPATFDWRMHVRDREGLTLAGDGALYRGSSAAMSVRVLSPAPAVLRVVNGHLPHTPFSQTVPDTLPPPPGILNISAGKAATARFLVVLAPARTAEAAAAITAPMRAVSGQGCAGLQDGSGVLLFRDAGAAECRYQEWSTDAAAFTSTGDVLSAERATRLRRGSATLFESDRPVTFALRGDGLVTTAGEPARIRIGEAAVSVPAGRHETTVRR